jgi:hypothetical protein
MLLSLLPVAGGVPSRLNATAITEPSSFALI